jgi:hypothetical protein
MRLDVSILICSLSLVTLCEARAADTQAALQAKYDTISKAFSNKDAAALDKMFGPKFVLIGMDDSKTTRKTIIADYKIQMKSMSGISWPRTVQKPTVTGSTATATVKGHFRGTVTLQGKAHLFEFIGTNRDTWMRKGPDWILIKSQVLALTATLDGKPIRRA